MTTEQHHPDDDIAAAARTLHREWDSPGLWPAIAAGMRAADGEAGPDKARPTPTPTPTRATAWRFAAVAAALALLVGSVTWLAWRTALDTGSEPPLAVADEAERLLTEETLAAIERAESQYEQAIDRLTALAAPKLRTAESPLVASLRERLAAIDMAIAECRTEIARNRFNAHLRRQLLFIYQEKRRTLEQIQEHDNAL